MDIRPLFGKFYILQASCKLGYYYTMISGVHFNHLRHENSWTSSLTFYSFFCLENASRESVKSPFLVNLVCRSTKFIEPWMTFFFQLRQPKKRRPEKQQTLPGCWFYYYKLLYLLLLCTTQLSHYFSKSCILTSNCM